jgi:hypothetical protein
MELTAPVEFDPTRQALALNHFDLSKIGLVVHGEPTFETWEELGGFLNKAEGAVHWWLGDWANYGEHRWGEMYTQAIEATGFAEQTIMNDKWVAGALEFSRRRENLPWSHHSEVAALPLAQQDELLAKAEKEGWSQSRMRREVGLLPRKLAVVTGTVIDDRILTGDIRELGKVVEAKTVDLIFTDPPYGYDHIPLYGELAKFGARVLKDGASLLCYCGQSVLPEVLAAITPYLHYHWTIAVQHSGGHQRLIGKDLFIGWKPILWFTTGSRRDSEFVSDFLKGEEDKEHHEWGQGISEARYFIETLTVEGELVCDPFLGGGTTCLAAKQSKRKYLGFEIDADTANEARRRIGNKHNTEG